MDRLLSIPDRKNVVIATRVPAVKSVVIEYNDVWGKVVSVG